MYWKAQSATGATLRVGGGVDEGVWARIRGGGGGVVSKQCNLCQTCRLIESRRAVDYKDIQWGRFLSIGRLYYDVIQRSYHSFANHRQTITFIESSYGGDYKEFQLSLFREHPSNAAIGGVTESWLEFLSALFLVL